MLDDDAGAAAEIDATTVDISTFDKTLDLRDIATKIRIDDIFHFPWFLPIETISPTHTVGKGRTNLTLIAPDIMQTDTVGTPYASFSNRQTQAGGPGVSVHFVPSAYGISGTGSYVVSFAISTFGPVTLNVGAYAGGGTTSGTGAKTVNGNVSVTVVLNNVPPSQQTYASIQQSGGSAWSWYSTSIEHPPLVFQP
jgi:hypothetical protein